MLRNAVGEGICTGNSEKFEPCVCEGLSSNYFWILSTKIKFNDWFESKSHKEWMIL